MADISGPHDLKTSFSCDVLCLSQGYVTSFHVIFRSQTWERERKDILRQRDDS